MLPCPVIPAPATPPHHTPPQPNQTPPHQIDRQWYGPALLWTRDDASGAWHPSADFPPGAPDAPDAAAPDAAAANGAATKAEAAPAAALIKAEACNGVAPVEAPGSGRRGRAARGSRAMAAAAAPPAAAKKRGAASAAAPAGAKRGVVAAGAVVTAEAAAPAAPLKLEEFEAALQASLCLVDVDVPLVALTDGVHSRSFAGNGLVVFQVGGVRSLHIGEAPPCLSCQLEKAQRLGSGTRRPLVCCAVCVMPSHRSLLEARFLSTSRPLAPYTTHRLSLTPRALAPDPQPHRARTWGWCW
jgi:hypothetical protein